MKGKNRRFWLGLAAIKCDGFACEYCKFKVITYHSNGIEEPDAEPECHHPSEAITENGPLGPGGVATLYVDCQGFEPKVPFKEASEGVTPAAARVKWKAVVASKVQPSVSRSMSSAELSELMSTDILEEIPF